MERIKDALKRLWEEKREGKESYKCWRNKNEQQLSVVSSILDQYRSEIREGLENASMGMIDCGFITRKPNGERERKASSDYICNYETLKSRTAI